jgi:hypothetical protein
MSGSSSSQGAGASASDALCVPAELLQAVNSCRPICPFFQPTKKRPAGGGRDRGCRKGARCPLLHTGPWGNEANLPHVSRVPGQGLTLRPPLQQALNAYFSFKGVPNPLVQGKSWKTRSDTPGLDMVTFGLINMVTIDATACVAAEQTGGVQIEGKWHGNSTAPYSGLLLHSTTVEHAMSILVDGMIMPSPGICGHGIYAFEVLSDGLGDLEATWRRGMTGGYQRGAAFLLRTRGVVVNAPSGFNLCAGVTGKRRDQYSVGPRTCVYESVSFRTEALMSFLADYLDQAGYTKCLHAALVAVRDYIDNAGPGQGAPPQLTSQSMIALQNTIVNETSVAQGQSMGRKRGPTADVPFASSSSSSAAPAAQGAASSSSVAPAAPVAVDSESWWDGWQWRSSWRDWNWKNTWDWKTAESWSPGPGLGNNNNNNETSTTTATTAMQQQQHQQTRQSAFIMCCFQTNPTQTQTPPNNNNNNKQHKQHTRRTGNGNNNSNNEHQQ